MVIEGLLVGLTIGYIFYKKNKEDIFRLSIKDLWLTGIGALLFWVSLQWAQRPSGGFVREYFFLIHPLSILLMSLGLLMGKKYFGKIIISLGFFLNSLVIFVNGKMPVSLNALLKINDRITIDLLANNKVLTHELMDNSKLKFLADIIPYQSPFFSGAKVISLGDVFVSVGFGIIFAGYIIFLFRREKND